MPVSKYLKSFAFTLFVLISSNLRSQNSVLLSLGSNTCESFAPSFYILKNPLTDTSSILAECDLTQQLGDYFYVYTAYNPKNNKVYIADTKDNFHTNIWTLDIGLPSGIQCPASIPIAPNYRYDYVALNFEFDNNGDLWSLADYVPEGGVSSIDRFDVTNGSIISHKELQFEAGHFPSGIDVGDLTILPNGRMFAALGNDPSRLYEIIEYDGGGDTARGIFLDTLPRNCFGIAYLNGLLEMSGLNYAGSCYYYEYDIAAHVLGPKKTFPSGHAPTDNTSFSPSLGSAQRLLNATKINSNTADLVYEIYVANTGNVLLKDINVIDDLAATFGSGNVSNVSAAFVPGFNASNLILNAGYNGTTNTSLLNTGQNLNNKVLSNANYFFKVLISFRAINLDNTTTYFNSSFANAAIGFSSALSMLAVSDSSNNGDSAAIDPNKNGNPGDTAENIPTPFNFGVLPVKFINASATLLNQNTALVKWEVATPMQNAAIFIVEFSIDGRNWKKAGKINIDNSSKSNWQLTHMFIPTGNLYYRVKQMDEDGSFSYSHIVLLKNKTNASRYIIYPNPANSFITISSGYDEEKKKTTAQLFDAAGRLLITKNISSSNEEINTFGYQAGTYLLRILNEKEAVIYKVIIYH